MHNYWRKKHLPLKTPLTLDTWELPLSKAFHNILVSMRNPKHNSLRCFAGISSFFFITSFAASYSNYNFLKPDFKCILQANWRKLWNNFCDFSPVYLCKLFQKMKASNSSSEFDMTCSDKNVHLEIVDCKYEK